MRPTRLLVIAAASLLGVSPSVPGEGSPRTYGTAQESLRRVGTTEFVSVDSSQTYSCVGAGSVFRCHPTNASNSGFAATPSLPSGALVTSVTFDVCDSSTSEDITVLALSVDSLGENEQLLGNAITSGTPGCAGVFVDVSAPGFVVDNASNQLVLLMALDSGDDTQSWAGATVRYKLQVSPAPATSTFGDVPMDHPYFQFIEALGDSGITAGCQASPLLYCPDRPITRGEMAVYLAKALGLQWP